MDASGDRVLLLGGGGKDSLASMELLEGAGIDYETFVYAHSVYGPADHRHELIERLVARRSPQGRHLGWVVDDAMDAPLTAAYPELGIRRIVAAETVSSYWTALPDGAAATGSPMSPSASPAAPTARPGRPVTGERINYPWRHEQHG